MFDFVYQNKRLIQGILFLLFIPFAFFWIGDYMRDAGGGRAVARVGDSTISIEEYSRALRDRQDAIRRLVEGRVDPAMLDNPQLREATLDLLIQRGLLLERARRAGLVVSDEQLDKIVVQLPEFKDESGKFSSRRAEEVLRIQGMRATDFRNRLAQDLTLQQISSGLAENAFVPRTVVERLARALEQQREVSHAVIAPGRFVGQVTIEADAAKKYYDANLAEFRVPEQARVEYAVLSVDSLVRQVQLDPAEVKRFYDSNRGQYEVRESRRASHIFFNVEPAAGAEAKQKVRARAEEIYREAQKNPDSFAALAKKHSQDPGSAAKGGDLGTVARGSMKDVPGFEDALYRLKPGEISAPVESKLGFHIIRLTALHPATIRAFEQVRGEIERELRQQAAARRYAELAENFNNVVYEQSETLKPAAELIKATLQTSGWISRERAAEPALNNPKLLAAIFSDETLKNGRNTEAVEVAPGVLVAARVIEHKPPSVRPFEEVRAGLEKTLVQRAAGRLAATEGRRLLEELRQGKTAQVAWSAPRLASHVQGKELPDDVLRLAFRAGVSKLPAYAGAESPQGGFTLVRISRVQEIEKLEPGKIDELAASLRQILGQEVLAAYVAALKQTTGVTIYREQLEKKDESAPPPPDRPAPPRRRGLP